MEDDMMVDEVDVIWWKMIWDRMMDDMICDGRWYEIEWWLMKLMVDDMMMKCVGSILLLNNILLVTACYDHGNRLDVEY